MICKMGMVRTLGTDERGHKISIHQVVVIIPSKMSLTKETEAGQVLTAWQSSYLDASKILLTC